jgi:hypothetical protein
VPTLPACSRQVRINLIPFNPSGLMSSILSLTGFPQLWGDRGMQGEKPLRAVARQVCPFPKTMEIQVGYRYNRHLKFGRNFRLDSTTVKASCQHLPDEFPIPPMTFEELFVEYEIPVLRGPMPG